MVLRWQSYLENGIFALSVPLDTPLGGDVTVGTNGQKNVVVNLEKNGVNEASFWTGPWPYWDMKELAPELWTTLSESGLVIFKVGLRHGKRYAQSLTTLCFRDHPRRETSSEFLVLEPHGRRRLIAHLASLLYSCSYRKYAPGTVPYLYC